jgi:phosphatidate cytidylyltransferase
MNASAPGPVRFADLGPRMASGLGLAAVSLACVWAGGWLLAVFAAAVLAAMLWEYHRMITGDPRIATPPFLVLALSGAAAVAATALGALAAAFACLLAGALVAALLAGRGFEWLVGGALYLGVGLCGLLALRLHEASGFAIIVWLVMAISASDIGAYFFGRTIGGRKLWPRVSPGKTWAGSLGGLASAAVVGAVLALAWGWPALPAALLGVVVALGAQAGDLLESALKRRAGVKDSSALIPGHGGVLDRLDGVLGGAWLYLVLHALGAGLAGA